MKKAGLLLLCGAFAVALVALTNSLEARPQYRKEHDAQYKGSAIEGALKEAKCNTCHYGKSKKNHNDYGKALIKAGLTKDSFTKLKKDKPALSKHVKEALEKVVQGEEGKKFADRIKDGKLPGTNPE
ncbi:MAG: hypothetical protein CMJ64_25360 [Planctomycetaceae bacterium]|nr:hypothetical protein [Planctomycetaceae bacterium]